MYYFKNSFLYYTFLLLNYRLFFGITLILMIYTLLIKHKIFF